MSTNETTEIKDFAKRINKAMNRIQDGLDMCRISQRVWLGSYERAAEASKEGLKSYGITHILTMGNDMSPAFPKDFQYLWIQIDDSREVDIKKHFPKCLKYILDALQTSPSNNVLIHCWAGISRSSTIAIVFRMTFFQESLLEAIESIRRVRYWILPNSGFFIQLEEYAEEQGLLFYGSHQTKQEIKEAIRQYKMCSKAIKYAYFGKDLLLTKQEIQKSFQFIFGQNHLHTLHIFEEIKDLF